ncbi:unnamed protein product [Aspergillus oryzae]|nr:unnamed protein product [Aspergillus oryzae]
MKFTGLIASLAAVSAASAAAIPTAALQPTLTQLSGVLGNIDGALGNVLSGADVTDLVQTQGELSKLTGTVSQRSVVGNELNTVGTVTAPVTSTVGGAVKPVVDTANSAVGSVEGLVDGTLPDTTKGTYCFQSWKLQ